MAATIPYQRVPYAGEGRLQEHSEMYLYPGTREWMIWLLVGIRVM